MTEHVAFQVQLTRHQHRRLKVLAATRGASMGSLIRESVTEYLNDVPVEEDPAYGIIGLIDDAGGKPHGSVAVHHDDYLADALEAEFVSDAEIDPRGAAQHDG
jgi:hypothetical protein